MDIESERKAFEERRRSKVEKIFAPDVKSRKEVRKALNSNVYFIIIGLVSILTIFIPPLFMGCLSSDIGLAFPKNLEGWILWIIMNGSTAAANISLYEYVHFIPSFVDGHLGCLYLGGCYE